MHYTRSDSCLQGTCHRMPSVLMVKKRADKKDEKSCAYAESYRNGHIGAVETKCVCEGTHYAALRFPGRRRSLFLRPPSDILEVTPCVAASCAKAATIASISASDIAAVRGSESIAARMVSSSSPVWAVSVNGASSRSASEMATAVLDTLIEMVIPSLVMFPQIQG